MIRIENIIKALCLALLCFSVTAFSPGNDCMHELRSIYKKMNTVSSENTAILLDYTVNTTLSEKATEKGVKTAPANVRLVISKNYTKCTSKEMSYYQDEKNAFTVIPSRKMVYWSNSTAGLKKERISQAALLQDTLFSMSKVIECRKEEGAGYNRCIVIQPNAKMQKAFNISKMSFYVNDSKEEVKKVVVTYLETDPVAQSEIVFNKIDFDHKQEDIHKPVKGLFIQGKSKLLPAYKNYTLVDNRTGK